MRENSVLSVVETDIYGCGNRMLDYALSHSGYNGVSNGTRNSQTEMNQASADYEDKGLLFSALERHRRH